jgi:hypothetical protein
MGQSFPAIDKDHLALIEAQKMFFVATAAPDGRVNLSPKGLDALRVVDANRVVWLNLSGSGNETAAHLLENPRMTLMMCAFDGPPKVLRLYGTARTLHEGDPDWAELWALFPSYSGARQLFDVAVDLVHTSCGMGVPIMHFVESRGETQLEPYFARLGPERTKDYQRKKNRVSLDGKPTDIT